MDDIYKIIDTREPGEFKIKSFSGYKRRDVFDALDKSILSKKIENACNWVCECICSGYIDKTWQHLITIASNVVNINNPTLSNFLYKKNVLFYNLYNNSKCKIELRNNSTIRNLMFGVTVILALSDKTKRYDKYPKLKDIDFDFSKIQTKLTATSNLLNFSNEKKINLKEYKLKDLLALLVDNGLYKKNKFVKELLINFIELYFLKEFNRTTEKNSLLSFYHTFLNKIKNTEKFNLDEESLFLEFKSKLLNV